MTLQRALDVEARACRCSTMAKKVISQAPTSERQRTASSRRIVRASRARAAATSSDRRDRQRDQRRAAGSPPGSRRRRRSSGWIGPQQRASTACPRGSPWFSCHDHPGAGELAHDEHGQVVGGELRAGRSGPPAPSAATARPQRQHDQRHRGGEHPDEDLGAVGDRLGEADAQQRRVGAQRVARDSRASPARSRRPAARRAGRALRTARASPLPAAGPRPSGRPPAARPARAHHGAHLRLRAPAAPPARRRATTDLAQLLEQRAVDRRRQPNGDALLGADRGAPARCRSPS